MPRLGAGAPLVAPRSADGTGNNVAHATWGATEDILGRFQTGAAYADDEGTPRAAAARATPVNVSRALESLSTRLAPATPTAVAWFGLFVFHDILFTHTNASEPFPFLKRDGTPQGFARSQHKAAAGDGSSCRAADAAANAAACRVRVPMNFASTYIDGGQLYGHTAASAAELGLRDAVGGGRLNLSSTGHVLPRVGNGGGPGGLRTGDPRQGVTPMLLTYHTLFAREHNRKAAELAAARPDLDDEALFQEARRWTIALIQSIATREYLPALIGAALPSYRGAAADQGARDAATGEPVAYDPAMRAGVDVLFATATMRYGHSTLDQVIHRLGDDWRPLREGYLLLRETVFNPARWVAQGIEPVLRGMVVQPEGHIDGRFSNDVTQGHAAGVDILALNVQRGRDHGVPTYNDARAALGLPRAASFADITDDAEVAAALSAVYEGDVDAVDAYIGGIAESPHAGGAIMGPLFAASMRANFVRLRAADRHWYEHHVEAAAAGSTFTVADVHNVTLSQLAMRNSDASWLPSALMGLAGPADAALATSAASTARLVQGERVAALSADYVLRWELLESGPGPAQIEFSVSVAGLSEPGAGYIGLGFGDDMVAIDLMIAWLEPAAAAAPDAGGQPFRAVVKDYHSDFFLPLLDTETGSTDDIVPGSASGSIVDGVTTITWRRLVRTPDAGDTAVELGDMPQAIVWSHGNALPPTYHGSSQRGSALINWRSGSFTCSATGAGAVPLLHGAVMWVSWTVAVPFAIALARYFKTWDGWLEWHEKMQAVAGGSIVGIAVVALVGRGGVVATEHEILGCALAAVVVWQGATGKATEQGMNMQRHKRWHAFVRLTHKVVGWSLMGGAMVNMVLGVAQLLADAPEARDALHVCQGVAYALVILCFGVLELRKRYPVRFQEASLWCWTIYSSGSCLLCGCCRVCCGRCCRQVCGGPALAASVAPSADWAMGKAPLASARTDEPDSGTDSMRRGSALGRTLSAWTGSRRRTSIVNALSAPASPLQTRVLPAYTWEDVNERVTAGAMWVVVDGLIIDCRSWCRAHPGGSRVIHEAIGTDVTDHMRGRGTTAGAADKAADLLSPSAGVASTRVGAGGGNGDIDLDAAVTPARAARAGRLGGRTGLRRRLGSQNSNFASADADSPSKRPGTGAAKVMGRVASFMRLIEQPPRYTHPQHVHSEAAYRKMLTMVVGTLKGLKVADDASVDSSVGHRRSSLASAPSEDEVPDEWTHVRGSLLDGRERNRLYSLLSGRRVAPPKGTPTTDALDPVTGRRKPHVYRFRFRAVGAGGLPPALPGEHYILTLYREALVTGAAEVVQRSYTPLRRFGRMTRRRLSVFGGPALADAAAAAAAGAAADASEADKAAAPVAAGAVSVAPPPSSAHKRPRGTAASGAAAARAAADSAALAAFAGAEAAAEDADVEAEGGRSSGCGGGGAGGAGGADDSDQGSATAADRDTEAGTGTRTSAAPVGAKLPPLTGGAGVGEGIAAATSSLDAKALAPLPPVGPPPPSNEASVAGSDCEGSVGTGPASIVDVRVSRASGSVASQADAAADGSGHASDDDARGGSASDVDPHDRDGSECDTESHVGVPVMADLVSAVHAGGAHGEHEVAHRKLASAINSVVHQRHARDITFLIKVYPDGTMSQLLAGLEAGAIVRIRGPFGEPLLCPSSEDHCWRNLVCIAGGSGITPMLQLLRFHLRNADASAAPRVDGGCRSRVSIVYACNSEQDILAKPELDSAAAVHAPGTHGGERVSVRLQYVLSRPTAPGSWPGHIGHITESILETALPPMSDGDEVAPSPESREAFGGTGGAAGAFAYPPHFAEHTRIIVCGPTPFERTVREGLRAHGVPDALVRVMAAT